MSKKKWAEPDWQSRGNEWEGEFHMKSEKEEGENGRSGRVE
jgi:hypothetical protein